MKVIRTFNAKPVKRPHFKSPLTRKQARWPHFFISYLKNRNQNNYFTLSKRIQEMLENQNSKQLRVLNLTYYLLILGIVMIDWRQLDPTNPFRSCRCVLDWPLMRFKFLVISITKCPFWWKVTKTHNSVKFDVIWKCQITLPNTYILN